MLRVQVTVNELSSRNATISGAGDEVTLAPGQSRVFEGSSISVNEAEPAEEKVQLDDQGNPLTDIGPGIHNNPNGITTAAIAPKMPKPGGETRVEESEGGMREVTMSEDPAKIRAAGGPDADAPTEKATPGEKPRDTQTEGNTKARTASHADISPEGGKKGAKRGRAQAKSAGTSSAKRSGKKGRR